MQLAVALTDDQERNRIGGVCGERRTVLLVHLVCVAVVGGQQNGAMHRENLLDDLAGTGVDCFHCFDSGIEYTGVSNHVAVCVVEDDNVVFAAVQTGKQLIGDFVCAHLRLQVVGCNLWRVDQCAVLAFRDGFHAAVKEEGNMCVLFGFCDAQLGQSFFGDIFAKGVVQTLRFEGNLYVWHGGIVLGHADIVQREEFAGKSVEVRINQGAGDLSCTVWTEVKEDDRIICRDSAFFRIADHAWNDKFVGDFVCIGIRHRLDGIFTEDAFAANQHIVCFFDTFPAVVAVHCIITAHYRSNFSNSKFGTFILELLYKVLAGGRRNISSVHEAMNIDVGEVVFLCHFQQTIQMFDVTVYATVGQKPH